MFVLYWILFVFVLVKFFVGLGGFFFVWVGGSSVDLWLGFFINVVSFFLYVSVVLVLLGLVCGDWCVFFLLIVCVLIVLVNGFLYDFVVESFDSGLKFFFLLLWLIYLELFFGFGSLVFVF